MTKRTVEENGEETTKALHFFYDAQSKPAFVELDGEKYHYIYNLQGDVVGIVDTAGNAVVEYKYNAWGETDDVVDSSGNGLGSINPIRYRGYFFDLEAGMYYLFNRYYNPEMARVCNADSTVIDAILGKNAFCYCYNSPINSIDVFGTEPSLLSFFADCHAAVQIDIVRTNQNIVMERPVTNMPSVIWRKSSNGSIDLYDTVTHEVWEVKKSTVPYPLAKRQLERYLTGQVIGCPSGSLKKGHLISGITQCGAYTVSYYSVAPGLIVYDIYDASTIMYPALSAIGTKIWQKYQEMEKGYRAVSKRGTVTAIVSAVSTAAKIAAAALTVVGTICTTGSIAAGLEAGKRLIYA